MRPVLFVGDVIVQLTTDGSYIKTALNQIGSKGVLFLSPSQVNPHHLQMQTVQKLHPPMKRNQMRLGVTVMRMMRKCDEQRTALFLIRPKLIASWGILHIIIHDTNF